MKQLNTVLQSGEARIRDGAGKAPDERRAGGDGPGRPGSDHVDAINQMFAEFELAYHNQFHRAYADEGSLGMAKKYWLSRLGRFPPRVILQATREAVSNHEYLPSLSVIARACKNALPLFGLPEAREAYAEACLAPNPKSAHAWSHPAVYHAGRAAGWFALASEPESKVFPRFEYHYRQLCARVMNGESLDVELPKGLPERASRQLDPQENQARLRELRERLKL